MILFHHLTDFVRNYAASETNIPVLEALFEKDSLPEWFFWKIALKGLNKLTGKSVCFSYERVSEIRWIDQTRMARDVNFKKHRA